MAHSFLTILYEFFIQPFEIYMFLRRPLVTCIALAFGCGPIGVILVLRRMILMGDAISHAILPGAAIGFLLTGLSLAAMSIGGFFAGLFVVLGAGMLSRATLLKEDASLAGFYLISLAVGVLLISTKGGSVDLMCVLLGTILAVDMPSLILVASFSSVTLIILAIIYRPLVLECYDPGYLRALQGKGQLYHYLFLFLVVLNLVSAFQAIGTLMTLGTMMLPAIAARFWAKQVWSLSLVAAFIALLAGYSGLLLSYHSEWPSGPSIILMAGLCYVISCVFGQHGSLIRRL